MTTKTMHAGNDDDFHDSGECGRWSAFTTAAREAQGLGPMSAADRLAARAGWANDRQAVDRRDYRARLPLQAANDQGKRHA